MSIMEMTPIQGIPNTCRTSIGWVYSGPPFAKIPEACRITGISKFALRKGCKDGSVPHVKIGENGPYLINIPALLEQLGVPFQFESDVVPGR